MNYKILNILFLLCIAGFLYAQDETAEELFEDGDYFFAREEFSEAAYLYQRVLQLEPENCNVHFKLGMALLKVEGREAESIDHFLQATESTVLKYRKNYYPEKRAPHHTWFFLGNAYRIDNQLAKALDAYETFKSIDNFERKYNLGVLEEEIKAVGRAKIIQDSPLKIYKSCYSNPISTEGKEYDAVISADEKVMVWMSSQVFYEAIMMSEKVNGKWSSPVNITPQVGSDGEMIPSGLSSDGTELLLVRRGEYDSDIYYSSYDGKLWSKAEPIRGEINSNFTEDHASFAPGDNKIIFASEQRGTLGGLDIFFSEKMGDGRWGEAVNAGADVNTEFDETSAYISPDGKTLIFSSKGHFNMGGYDVFQCSIADDGSFGSAYNIGYPINTTTDNIYYVPVKDGNSAVYSMRDEEGPGQKDVWFIEIIPYEESVARALTRLSDEDFTIELTNKDTGKRIKLIYDSVNDRINVTSDPDEKYSVVYSRNGNRK